MNQTATSARYENEVKRLAKYQLWKHPSSQAEKIAKHYCAHAIIALQLAELLAIKEDSKYNPDFTFQNSLDLDLMIERLAGDIKRNHAYDFGIDLEWRQP